MKRIVVLSAALGSFVWGGNFAAAADKKDKCKEPCDNPPSMTFQGKNVCDWKKASCDLDATTRSGAYTALAALSQFGSSDDKKCALDALIAALKNEPDVGTLQSLVPVVGKLLPINCGRSAPADSKPLPIPCAPPAKGDTEKNAPATKMADPALTNDLKNALVCFAVNPNKDAKARAAAAGYLGPVLVQDDKDNIDKLICFLRAAKCCVRDQGVVADCGDQRVAVDCSDLAVRNAVAKALVTIYFCDGFKDTPESHCCPGTVLLCPGCGASAKVTITDATFSACPDRESEVLASGPSRAQGIMPMIKIEKPTKEPHARINLAVKCASFSSLCALNDAMQKIRNAYAEKNKCKCPNATDDKQCYYLDYGLDVSQSEAADLGSADILKCFGGLTALNVAGRTLDCDRMASIGQLLEIRHLYISDTPTIDDAAFLTFVDAYLASRPDSDWGQLQLLDVARCTNLGPASFAAMGRLTSLQKMRLMGTRIRDDDLDFFSCLPLTHLNLAGTSISGAGVGKLPPSLVWLDVHRAQIGNRGFAVLAHFTSLQYLDVSYNFISDQGVAWALCAEAPFCSMTQLYLNGNGNSITFESHNALMSALCCREKPCCLYDIYFTTTVSPVNPKNK